MINYATPEFNTLAADVFNERLAQAYSVAKTNICNAEQIFIMLYQALILKFLQIKQKTSQ